jgi:phosphopantothenoylcysteine decarboxylase/phosphopantothenate--cysteine ligase
MWDHPATRRNVADLAAQGRVSLVGPVRGEVASGDEGMGRMAEPSDIAAAALALLGSNASGARDLASLRVVVTAGPTLEDIDPVRFLGNRSSGKMGFAVAAQAAARGAEVTLVSGPASLPTPAGVRRVDVRGALEMRAALWNALGQDLSGADALIMAAAVADHRPAQVASSKIKKGDASATIELVKNPDLLGEVGAARTAKRPVLVGFAVETAGGDALVAYARRKLQEKRVDLVVANEASDSFGREDNLVVLVGGERAETLPKASKSAIADMILDRVRVLL